MVSGHGELGITWNIYWYVCTTNMSIAEDNVRKLSSKEAEANELYIHRLIVNGRLCGSSVVFF